ncbi:hypothetical protein LCGC14_2821190, partial [marine sediment metagenome]
PQSQDFLASSGSALDAIIAALLEQQAASPAPPITSGRSVAERVESNRDALRRAGGGN